MAILRTVLFAKEVSLFKVTRWVSGGARNETPRVWLQSLCTEPTHTAPESCPSDPSTVSLVMFLWGVCVCVFVRTKYINK